MPPQDFLSDPIQNAFSPGFFHEEMQIVPFLQWKPKLVREQALFVGTHPDYARRPDVEIQLRLARPEVRVVADRIELARQVEDWFANRSAS